MQQGPTALIADRVAASTLRDVPSEAIRVAKACLLDAAGVTLAGQTQAGAMKVTQFARGMGGRLESTILGVGVRASPFAAALANGTAAAILDYDDTCFRSNAHLSGCLLPASLALAEARRMSGKAVLEAYIVGFEAANKIGSALQPDLTLGGRHATGIFGTLGATAACAKLLGLHARAIAVAFGIAASCVGSIRGNVGSMAKSLHSGAAASNAVLAASLAADGFTARSDILEATYGLAQTTVPSGRYRLDEIGKDWGEPWDLVDPGVGIKFQPSGSMSFCAGECAKDLALRHDLQPEDIQSIACKTTRYAMDIGPFGVPDSVHEAMYSIPWAIAVGLADRKTGLAQFSAERISDPITRSLAARVKLSVHLDLANVTDLHDTPACELSVVLADGRTLTQFRRRPVGYPGGEPWTDELLAEKFRETAGMALTPAAVEHALTLLRRIDELPDVRELTDALKGPVS